MENLQRGFILRRMKTVENFFFLVQVVSMKLKNSLALFDVLRDFDTVGVFAEFWTMFIDIDYSYEKVGGGFMDAIAGSDRQIVEALRFPVQLLRQKNIPFVATDEEFVAGISVWSFG